MDDQDNVAPIRTAKGQFVKGQSGNPLGGNKPRIYRTPSGDKIDVQQLYIDNAPRVFVELMKLILSDDVAATAKVSAIKEFNDRTFGKAAQQMRITKGDDSAFDTFDAARLSDAALAEIHQARLIDGTK